MAAAPSAQWPSCPVCGQRLPPSARYCARCGSALRVVRARRPIGLVFGLWAGSGLEAGLAAVYAYIYFNPALLQGHAAAGVSIPDLRSACALIALGGGGLSLVQAAGTALWMRGNIWGRVLLSLACVVWGLTLVGLIPAALVLYQLWRRPPPSPLATLAP